MCLIAFVICGALAIVAVEYYYPNVGTIGTLEVYIDDIEYFEGNSVNWSVCQPGYMYWKNMTVANIGDTTLNISILPDHLPFDWVLTWDANNVELGPNEFVMGWLNLTIPIDAIEWGEWGFYLIGE